MLKPYLVDEPCPDCGKEVQILSDGTSDCPECGHPEVLPCNICPRLTRTIDTCDWNEVTRCSEFPQHYLYNLTKAYTKENYDGL